MGKLIPNLDDLRAKLLPEESALDAREFLSDLAKAGTRAEINANVDVLVDLWLAVPDDSE